MNGDASPPFFAVRTGPERGVLPAVDERPSSMAHSCTFIFLLSLLGTTIVYKLHKSINS
jgi:hypothetical protein